MIKGETFDLNNTYIEITTKSKMYLNDFLMNFLSFYIGSKSKLNYHMMPAIKNKLIIPIYPYELSETHESPINLIEHKLDELQKTLKQISWNDMSKQFVWLINAAIKCGFKPSSDLECKIISPSLAIQEAFPKPIPMEISQPEKTKIKVYKVQANDKSIITTILDPCVADYGIYVDLSIPFSEMGMCNNGLHLFEHLSTKAWDDLSEKDCIMVNGTTNAAGISYVYSIHRTYDSFKTYLNAAIDFLYKSRDVGFWDTDDMKKAIELETVRTISEMREGRSRTLMARSDLHAYSNMYNVDVFRYWSNRPYNVLCVVKSENELFAKKNVLDELGKKYPLQNVKRPENIKYDKIPAEVLLTKMSQNYQIKAVQISDNAKHLFYKKIERNTLYGIDCKLTVFEDDSDESVEDSNNNLCTLLFYNRYVSAGDIEKYCNTNVLPFSNMEYTSSINAKFSSEFYH